ncbi:MAG TPA: sigma-70 family RNA polymerase sigma factor [Flavobacterium sp.]|nr:sigma-70 family RNA polymerase sigma factor [Flavobacterium sp.]
MTFVLLFVVPYLMSQKEFLALVLPYKQKVFRLAKRLLTSTEEAEDATQEVLIKLWHKNQDIEKYNSVEAMMMTMTKNYCLDRLKSKQASNLQLTHSNYSNRDNLEKHTELKDKLDWVRKIIDQLPEAQKIVVQLREIEELAYDEIAEIMQMNPTHVRVTLSRARKTIREQMTKINNYGIS